MRLKQQSESKTVLVQIKTKQRDTAETVKDANGKMVKNERYGKFYYETVETFELEDATPAEVKEVVVRGLTAATKK